MSKFSKVYFIREDLTAKSWMDLGFLPEDFYIDFDAMWNLHPEDHHQVMTPAGLKPIPRFQTSYLRDYAFSGNVSKAPKELPKEFKPLLRWANNQGYGQFNQLLVNWYTDGNSYIGSHADQTKPLVNDSAVMTISLRSEEDEGPARKFRIRRDGKILKDYITENRMVLVMGGKFQKELKHEIVKVSGNKASEIGPRISVTLRQFKD